MIFDLQAQFSGGWQWCCQRCFDKGKFKSVTPADFVTYNPEDGEWWDVISVEGLFFCRHLIHAPHTSGNVTRSCGQCAPKKLGCTPVAREMVVVFDDDEDTETRVRAGLVLLRADKMAMGTRDEVATEIERLFDTVVSLFSSVLFFFFFFN